MVDVRKQPHYTKLKIQPVTFITENNMDYLEGNIIKYICRYKHKGTPSMDLQKAKHYLDMLIDMYSKGKVNP